MKERIYIAGATALVLHLLLYWWLDQNVMAPKSVAMAANSEVEVQQIEFVDVSLIPAVPKPPPTLDTKPAANPPIHEVNLPNLVKAPATPASATPASATSVPATSVPATKDQAPQQPSTNRSDMASNSHSQPLAEDKLIPESSNPSTLAGPTRSLSMRGKTVSPIDVRGSGQLAAAIAAAPGPSQSARSDLLQGGPIPEIGATPTWRPDGNGTFRADKEPFEAKITRDGRIHFRDKPNVKLHGVRLGDKIPMPMIVGSFDVTDAVMASFGEALYPYRKLKLMDESREARGQMAIKYRDEMLQDALLKYRRRLTKIWKNSRYSLSKRKSILFSLWDECAEKGPATVVRTARSIRVITLKFIRKTIPKNSPDAYTAAELLALNARRESREKFEPY